MDRVKRPANVTASAWIIIVVSALMLIGGLASLLQTREEPLGALLLVIFAAGLAYSALRLAVGVAVLRGANWARITYLIAEFLVLNFAVLLLGKYSLPPTPAQAVFSVLPGVSYLIVLILLTRRSALIFFGRPVAPAVGTGKVVLALVLFCFVYAGLARLASALGLRAMSMASDDWNPVTAVGNALGDATGLPLLQSSTYIEVKALRKSIDASSSLEQVAENVNSPVYEARSAVSQNQAQVILLWIVHFVGLPILLRRH